MMNNENLKPVNVENNQESLLLEKIRELEEENEELKRKNRKLEENVAELNVDLMHDPLTGLKTRRYLAEMIDLKEHGITTRDYSRLLDSLEEQNKIRHELIEVAQYLKKIGRTVGIATKSSQGLAEEAAKRYGFDFGVGSEEHVAENGRIIGVKRLVGDRRGRVAGVPMVTKMDRVVEALRNIGINAARRNIALVSDGYDDVKMFGDTGFGVLIRPSRPGTLQKVSQKLGLSDAQVAEGNTALLKLLLRFPKASLASKKRLGS